jgi:hypothetical protein
MTGGGTEVAGRGGALERFFEQLVDRDEGTSGVAIVRGRGLLLGVDPSDPSGLWGEVEAGHRVGLDQAAGDIRLPRDRRADAVPWGRCGIRRSPLPPGAGPPCPWLLALWAAGDEGAPRGDASRKRPSRRVT